MAAPVIDETPFQRSTSRFDPPGTIRREICLAMEAGETPADDVINIWLCEEYVAGPTYAPERLRRWRCVHSRLDGMLGQILTVNGAAGFEVIGATPGMPAMNLWVQHVYRHAGQRPEAQRDDVIPPAIMEEIRQHVRDGRLVPATKLVYHNSTRDLKASRDYVRQLAAEAKRDDAVMAIAQASPRGQA